MEGTGVAKVGYSCNKGNYKGYYKMRPESNNRLQYLSDEWFRGKACLDVGCNDGQFCIALADTFVPAYILGIDPDFVLIDSAQSRLKRLLYAENQKAVQTATSTQAFSTGLPEAKPKPVVAFRSGFLPRALAVKAPVKRIVSAALGTDASSQTASLAATIATTTASVLTSTTTFPHNVVFKARDIFDLSCTLSSQKEGKYDTITCFSVSKWVHLNGGDSKLLEFFCRLYSLVRSGGRVIIEYQPWKSYENNKGTSDTTKAIFPTIQIKPDLFEWVLTFIVGFEIEARGGVHLDHAKGFDRPILVLRRPVSTSSAGGASVTGSGSAASDGIGATAVSRNSNTTSCVVMDGTCGADAANTSKVAKKSKANNSSTDGFRDGKKLWENVSSFADLCNIVYKRIQRGTVVSISNTSGTAGAVVVSGASSGGVSGTGSGASSGAIGSSGECSGSGDGCKVDSSVGTSGTNTDVAVSKHNDNAAVSLKRSAEAVEETVPGDKKSKKSKKADK